MPKCMINIQFLKVYIIIRDGIEIYLILFFKKWYSQFLHALNISNIATTKESVWIQNFIFRKG